MLFFFFFSFWINLYTNFIIPWVFENEKGLFILASYICMTYHHVFSKFKGNSDDQRSKIFFQNCICLGSHRPQVRIVLIFPIEPIIQMPTGPCFPSELPRPLACRWHHINLHSSEFYSPIELLNLSFVHLLIICLSTEM